MNERPGEHQGMADPVRCPGADVEDHPRDGWREGTS